jgi:hypothetical protein
MKEQLTKIFDDLDNYRKFCVEYGYVFNEAHLYKGDTPWGQYSRWRRGDRVVDNWKKDSRYVME